MPLDRQDLVSLLASSPTAASEACSVALFSGADFEHWDSEAVPAGHLAGIYRRRAEHVRRIGLDVVGIEEAVAEFEAAREAPIALAIVHGENAEYPIFLAADESTVIACLEVPSR